MNEDLVVQKLIELDEKVSRLATQESVKSLQDNVADQLDRQLVILQRLDQERLFTIERVKRLEDDVERLKLQLKIV